MMITTLDAQPQEWMSGKSEAFHTVAACHFDNLEHIEYWIHKLVPKNSNGEFIKWSGGRGKRKEQARDQFIENCLLHLSNIDFSVNCVSSSEGEMSWFAWAFYMQNRTLVSQQSDAKNRNCLVFHIDAEKTLSFPVLRAGYLVWYHHVIRYLADVKGIQGKLISDNFACDGIGPGEGKALGVSFVNFLLAQSGNPLQVSLPITERYKACDRLSDYFCGLVNSVQLKIASASHVQKLEELSARRPQFIDSITFATNLKILDEVGHDVTEAVKLAVIQGSIPKPA